MTIGNVIFRKYVDVKFHGVYNLTASAADGYVADFSMTPYKDEYRVTSKFQEDLFSTLGVKNNAPDLNSIGSLYITSSAEVPRYKLRDLKEKHNVSVVRDPNKANTIVISQNEIDKLCDTKFGQYMYNKTEFIANFLPFLQTPNIEQKFTAKNYKLPYSWRSLNIKDILNSFTTFINSIQNSDVEILVLSYHTRDILSTFMNAIDGNVAFLDNSANSTSHIYFFAGDDISKILLYSNKNVYTDKAFQSIIGSGAIDINQYQFINQLLDNNEDSNVEMGLTLMANCNFEKSVPYLMLLVTDYYSRHRHLNYTKSVAFKSLLSFIGVRTYNVSFDIDDIMNAAKEYNLITDELKELIKKRFMNNYSHIFNADGWIQVKDIIIVDPKPDGDIIPVDDEDLLIADI